MCLRLAGAVQAVCAAAQADRQLQGLPLVRIRITVVNLAS